MTKRLNGTGERPDPQYQRDAYDWYREPPACVEALADVIDFSGSLVWDPCAGGGNVLDVFKARGHATVASDIVDRSPRHKFFRGNFLQCTKWPIAHDRPLDLITNPPYGYIKGIAETMMRHACNTIPFRYAAFLLPIEFLASSGRSKLFSEFRPSHVVICSQRPSMPPGAMVEVMGADAYRGGMADYVWIVHKPPFKWRTELLWTRPTT